MKSETCSKSEPSYQQPCDIKSLTARVVVNKPFPCWYVIGSCLALTMREGTLSELIRRLRGSVAMMVFARKTLLVWAKSYLTRKLIESPDMEGTVGELDLRLAQGLVILRAVRVVKRSEGRRAVEAFCREISIQIEWGPLLHGTLVGRATVQAPHFEIFPGRENEKDEQGERAPADALLALCRETHRLMPFHLRSLEVNRGCIEYHSQFTSPPFQLALDEISLSATNLTNVASAPPARVFIEGWTTGNGRFWTRLDLPSFSDPLTFDLQAGLNRINLVDLNELLRAYAKFDLKKGICSIYAEFNSEQGRYQGVIQPRFKDLDVFAWHKEHGKSFLQICRQAAIAFLSSLFKNKPRDELALNIPVSGTFDDPDVDTWAAIGSLLKNAFVSSLLHPSKESASPKTEKKGPSLLRFWERKPSPC